METRKLQRVGGGTYTVSIPKEWATARGLEAGTTVSLHSHLDGSLVVRSHERDRGCIDAVCIAVDDDAAAAGQLLRAAGTAGFDEVTLVTDDSFSTETVRAVRSLVRGFVGSDLVDERDDRLVVRSLLDSSDVSVRQSVVQLQFVALSVHGRAADALTGAAAATNGDEQLRDRAAEADRLCEMVARHLSRALVSFAELDRLGVTRPALFDYYETARHLDAVAAEGATIAAVGARLSEPLTEETGERLTRLADATRAVVENASVAVLEQRDAGTVHGIHRRREEADAELAAWLDALHDGTAAVDSTVEAVAVTRSLDALSRTLAHGGAIADVALRSLARNRCLPTPDD